MLNTGCLPVNAEETAFEYAMVLFSVLIGLAVADVATSFHRLMRHRQHVRWDPLVLTVAVYALCTAVYMWFDIWGVRHFGITRQFLFYLGLVAELIVLFLMAAASLPDDVDNATDLTAYYAGNRRYFWSLMALFQFSYSAFGFFFAGGEGGLSLETTILLYVLMIAPFAISTTLIFTGSRALHWVGIGLLLGIMLLHYGMARIG